MKYILALMLLSLTLLAGCNLLSEDAVLGYPAEFQTDALVYLVCSEACQARGQCGTAQQSGDQQYLVMLNGGQPATQGHGTIISHNTPVLIRESRLEDMVSTSTNEGFQMRFYKIFLDSEQGGPAEGWVHALCVSNKSINR